MDVEKSGDVLDASETPQPEETVMEKEVVSESETPNEPTEPENPAAAEEEMAVNGHDTEVTNLRETEEVIVKETDTLSEKKAATEIGDNLPKGKSEMEPDVVTPPELDESSEKISDPVAALDMEPENTQAEQQPVPENDPEPLPMKTPLADSAAEPEPEKKAESVPEAQLPTSQEERVSETELRTTMDTGAKEVSKEKMAEKDVAVDPTKEGEGKTTETVSSEKPNDVNPTEDKKEGEPENKESDSAKAGEVAAPEDEGVKSEENGAELQKEEDTAPAPGSLSFAFLEQEKTKNALQTSRTIVILRGLPGSGKSFLSRAIADAYKDHCSVICADEHGVKPEDPESSAPGYKALDEAVVACGAGTTSSLLIVVDDTNHTQDRLARLGEIAKQHHLVPIFLEPRTEWSRDVALLKKKTKRELEEAKLEVMKGHLEEMSLPLFFGWFLLSSVQDKVRCTSMDFVKTLDTLEAFKKHFIDFTGKAEKEVDLEQYFKPTEILHCTTKFCNYGKKDGAKEYAQNPAVKDLYGSVFELSLSALFVTPRTVGARVSLTEEQLLLWPADAEKEVEASASLPLGSRAHVSLGCAEGVEPVQTGLDLLEILAVQQGGQSGELVEEMELGSLTYYGEGRWLLSLREPICVPACFSSFYGPKEIEPAKKEPEKKKKPKCAIL